MFAPFSGGFGVVVEPRSWLFVFPDLLVCVRVRLAVGDVCGRRCSVVVSVQSVVVGAVCGGRRLFSGGVALS
jgi:hypothetical protein